MPPSRGLSSHGINFNRFGWIVGLIVWLFRVVFGGRRINAGAKHVVAGPGKF